jgi:hypothetical protein
MKKSGLKVGDTTIGVVRALRVLQCCQCRGIGVGRHRDGSSRSPSRCGRSFRRNRSRRIRSLIRCPATPDESPCDSPPVDASGYGGRFSSQVNAMRLGKFFPESHFGARPPTLSSRITKFGLHGHALIGFTAQTRFGVLFGLTGMTAARLEPGGFRQRSRSMR